MTVCAKCGHPIEMTSVGRYGTRDHMQRGCSHRPAPRRDAGTSTPPSMSARQRLGPASDRGLASDAG